MELQQLLDEAPVETADVLRAVVSLQPDGSRELLAEPLIPLLDTTLLTNAPGEPRVGSQLLTEIHSADRIDVVMAFIRKSGIRPLLDALRRHCEAGRPLRVLTTAYTRSTEGIALDALLELGANVRVSYDTSGTRLHAKAWLFHRDSGFSTAYIGSSNLTHSAQHTGLEWNVRVSGARNRTVVERVGAVFETYWNSVDFKPYDAEEFTRETNAPAAAGFGLLLSPIELRPEPFQERLLEQIAVSREQGHHRNLLVSATGTGKTVMAAVDYSRLRETLPRARLLFVAHREEILEQSRATFRHCLRAPTFGELWVGGQRPRQFDHVFASIQSISSAGLSNLDPHHFDVVIVDEFHHAAARSYRTLLEHLEPLELLGLTATPERADGLPILEWFDHRIAAELRIWDAIDQHRLAPFLYYGLHDGLDLSSVPWQRGRGYDVQGLTNLFTADDIWARRVIAQLKKYVDDVSSMRALGFCVSVAHAQFMARVFSEAGIAATAVWADTHEEARSAALSDLAAKRVNIVFSVDLFNEGIDVPSVDTLLFLRPTDSPTLFLQQLGRGLRKWRDKTHCTVLDFVGHHRKEFRFDKRFRALLGGSRSELIQHIQKGFPFLPAGCHLELDRVASEIVLKNIKEAVPSTWRARCDALRELAADGKPVTLSRFLQEYGFEIEDVYASDKSWSDMLAQIGRGPEALDEDEKVLRRACGRLLHIDDRVRIDSYRAFLSSERPPDVGALSERERRLLRMLVASIGNQLLTKDSTLKDGCALLWKYVAIRLELLQVLHVLASGIDHVHWPLETRPDVPLQIHARYTRIEILAAFEKQAPPGWLYGRRVRTGRRTRKRICSLSLSTRHLASSRRRRAIRITPSARS